MLAGMAQMHRDAAIEVFFGARYERGVYFTSFFIFWGKKAKTKERGGLRKLPKGVVFCPVVSL